MDDLRIGDTSGLTFFGQWITVLCELLGTNVTALSEQAGVGRATISDLIYPKTDRAGKSYEARPRIETLERLWETIQVTATARIGQPFPQAFQESFWNASGYVFVAQYDQARMRLEDMRLMTTLIREKDQEIEQLRRELNALRKRPRRRRT